MCLFLSVLLGKLYCCIRCWKNNKKLTKLYKIGNKLIEKEMDLVNILKTIKDSNIINQHLCKDPLIKKQVYNNPNKIICLDSDPDSMSIFLD